MRRAALVLCLFLAVLLAPAAQASPYIRYGIQDDAWLQWGPGTLDQRLTELHGLGVDVTRYTLDWRAVEPKRGVYDWSEADAVLNGLHTHGIAPVVTLWGTPSWANGGRGPNVVPSSKWTFAAFARAAAERYHFVHLWTIWNEPNQRMWLLPASPRVYTQMLLNPAYGAIHNVERGEQVAGGVTAPRGNTGGVSPLAWVSGMRAAHAHLDAYAHNPYPLSPSETPVSGGCGHCMTVTMATMNRLLTAVRRAFGTRVRVWLTEYGYQTNPPDRYVGVPYAKQAKYVSEAALRAHQLPRVDILIHYLVQDEPNTARWQSGLYTTRGRAKPSLEAFRFPLTQLARRGLTTTLWGQVRPGGAERYVLQQQRHGHWYSVGGLHRTTARGYLTRKVRAGRGARFRLWVPSAHSYSAILTVS
jgi:hypothetical protein